MKLFLAFIFLCFQSDGALGGEVDIYYFNHPICESAEYKGDVLEMVSEDMDDRTVAKKSIENFLLTVKANVASKFGANIICGAKYESNIYSYSNGMYVYKVLTMTFTGTAMKTL